MGKSPRRDVKLRNPIKVSDATWLSGFSPVADEARVALVDVHNSLGVDVEADEDASQQVAGRWTQRSHHVHDG